MSEQTEIDLCIRCGKCCVVYNIETKEWEDCKHLFKSKTLRYKNFNHLYTACCCYHMRFWKDLGNGFRCGYRKDLHFDIPGCPYNTSEDPIHPAYLNSQP